MPRIISWFSCGAPSAVTAKLIVEKYGDEALVVNCDTLKTEHPDNARFYADVQAWVGHEFIQIHSDKFADIDDVFENTGYMSGIRGARCTAEMKKRPRYDFQLVDDVHCFGYTIEEQPRITRFEQNNPELYLEWILRDRGITRAECLQTIANVGIALPIMYSYGFKNNNCLGCVKATSPKYWNTTREIAPEVFNRRCKQSRAIGVRLVRYKGERIFLDALPLDAGKYEAMPDISCGPQCSSEDSK